jgi:hypothetical protein
METPLPSRGEASELYLQSTVAACRSARRGEYVIVHFRSGTFLRTDRLGAVLVKRLIDGRSDIEAIAEVDRIEPGAGERARRLVFALRMKGALSPALPHEGRRRARARRWKSMLMGLPVAGMGPILRYTPAGVLGMGFRLLLTTPIGRGTSRPQGKQVMSSAGAGRERGDIPPVVRPNRSFNHLFMILAVSLSPKRLDRLVDSMFDNESVDRAAQELESFAPAVGVFLHSPLCQAVPNALRIRGYKIARVVIPWTHGFNLSPKSGPLRDFFGDRSDQSVDSVDPRGTPGLLLRQLKAGSTVYVALDNIIHVRDETTGDLHRPNPAATIEMLGLRFPRNDGPAWLAELSRRPVVLWSTHTSGSGVVLTASPPLWPDPSLTVDRRVADLSERLYRHAEAAIRQHPEAWRYWSHLDMITVD